MSKNRIRIISGIMFLLGTILIIFSLYPIFEYEYISRKRFPVIVSPLSDEERRTILTAPLKDYKKISNWSSEYQIPTVRTEDLSYTISIPKLGIKDAEVRFGGEDLSESLIQYPGTAEPGNAGNAVVFGHSVLPMFFNPKNYLTIFSTLPKLKEKDEIFVNIEGVMYKYEVIEMFEVQPDNLEILDQKLTNSYLSLITCVPPGHPLKPRRLVVRAMITKI